MALQIHKLSRLSYALIFAILMQPCQWIAPISAAAAPTPSAPTVEADMAKSLYTDISQLVKDYFPRARLTISGNKIHFEYKVHSQIGLLSHLTELAPDIGGVLCDLEIKPGQYKGNESLPKRINLVTYEALLLAPYSAKVDRHIMAKLSFDPGTSTEFLEQFKDIVNRASAAAIAPSAAASSQATPADSIASNVSTAATAPAAAATSTASSAPADSTPQMAPPALTPPKAAATKTISTSQNASTATVDSTASTVPAIPQTPAAAAAATAEKPKEKQKDEKLSKAASQTETHPADALHDRDNTRDPWHRNQVLMLYYKNRAVEQTAVIAAKPKDPVAYSERSDCYLHFNNPKQAFADADKSVALCPKGHRILPYAYGNRGEARIQLKQYKEALEDLNKSIALNPESAESIYFRGMVKEKNGDIKAAVKDYELSRSLGFSPSGVQSVQYNPYMADVEKRIKKAWFPPKGNESRAVVTTFEILRNGSVKNIKIYKSSGIAIADKAALIAIENAAPFPPLPYRNRNSIDIEFRFAYNVFTPAWQISQTDSADVALQKMDEAAIKKLDAAEKSGDAEQLFYALTAVGDVRRVQGRYASAEKYYNRSLELYKEKEDKKFDNSIVLGRLAISQSAQGKMQDADTNFKAAFKLAKDAGKNQLDPDVTDMLTEYAKFLYKSSRFAEANKIYTMLKQ